MHTKPVLLAIGGNLPHTSFGRITRHILAGWSGFEVHQLCISELTETQKRNPFYHAVDDLKDIHGKKKLIELIHHLHPSVLWIYSSIAGICRYLEIIQAHAVHLPIIAYCAIENVIIPHWQYLQPLSRLTRLVVFSHFAQQEVQRAFAYLDMESQLPCIEVIPHGIDTTSFQPFSTNPSWDEEDRRMNSRKIVFDRELPKDAFIVLNWNLLQARKRIDITIQAFSQFISDKPNNIFLCVHPGKSDAERNALSKLIQFYEIEDRVLPLRFIGSKTSIACSDTFLNHLYNACEVGLNTSGGEGWGLVSFEHAATRAAQIMPDQGACKELWEGHAALVPIVSSSTIDDFMYEMHYVSTEGVARSLNMLYHDRSYLLQTAQSGYLNSTKAALKWDVINEQWQNLMDKVLCTV